MLETMTCASSSRLYPKLSNASELLYTCWLFTRSDVITFVLPSTLFGIFGLFSGLNVSSQSHPVQLDDILRRLLNVVAFNWFNTLIFDIANQRLPAAIIEDAANKPWRPLPTKRITPDAAKALLLITIPVVLVLANLYNVGFETATLITMTWMYNDLGRGDVDYLVRNALVAAAFALYNTASLKLALDVDHLSMISATGRQWILIVSGIVLTTMHVIDLKDQEGDRQVARRTAPLILGNDFTRWTLVAGVGFWSLFCPWFWGIGLEGFLLSGGLGTWVAIRVWKLRDRDADRKSWQIWAWWTVTLHSLPFLKAMM